MLLLPHTSAYLNSLSIVLWIWLQKASMVVPPRSWVPGEGEGEGWVGAEGWWWCGVRLVHKLLTWVGEAVQVHASGRCCHSTSCVWHHVWRPSHEHCTACHSRHDLH